MAARKFAAFAAISAFLLVLPPSVSAKSLYDYVKSFTARIQCKIPAEAHTDAQYAHYHYVSGSGSIVFKEGYILTNYHVVKDAEDCSALLGQKEYAAKITGRDRDEDLAMLKIDGGFFPTARFGDSNKAVAGKEVWLIGYPDEFNDEAPTLRRGVITNTAVRIHDSPFFYYLGSDTQVFPGDSGGVLMDSDGLVIGITAGGLPGTSFGFFIPVNYARAEMLLLRGGDIARSTIGDVAVIDTKTLRLNRGVRAYAEGLGILPGNLAQDGVVVSEIKAGPAEKAGLLKGDLITSVNGFPIKDYPNFFHATMDAPPGTKLTLDFIRGGKKLSLGLATEAIANENPDKANSASSPPRQSYCPALGKIVP